MIKKWLCIVFLISASLFAQGNDQAFVPYLIDLDGYQAEQAQGMYLNMGGIQNVTASREYESSSENLLTVLIMKTNQPDTFEPMTDETVDYSGPDGQFQSTTIEGYKTYISLGEGLRDGAVMILLEHHETEATFISFSFENNSLDEIKKIIGKFDLKAIQAKAKSF